MIDRSTLRLVAMTENNLRDGVSGLVARACAACAGGATMVHVRLGDESPRTILDAARALVAAVAAPVLVHHRVDIALAAGAAGVHLGVHDLDVNAARHLVGDGFVIGKSAGNELEMTLGAAADYLVVGPVFRSMDRRPDSALGVEELARLAGLATIPVVAIGGVSVATAPRAMDAGAAGVALIGAMWGAPDPAVVSRQVRAAIGM